MNEKRALLNHFLAALAYRTQKALRGAPADFGSFNPLDRVRSPKELIRHMTSVLGYSRTYFIGGSYWPEPLESLDAEVERFHQMLANVSEHLVNETPLRDGMTEEQLLQGPFADTMTHAGQLAMLRRFAGAPVVIQTCWIRSSRKNSRSTPQQWPAAIRGSLITIPSMSR